MRLQPFDGLGRPQQRDRHERQHVGGDAPQHAVRQRIEAQVEQGVRRQKAKAERAFRHDGARQPAGLDDPWQQQRVGPHCKPGDDAGNGPARGGIAPQEAAEERRRELRDGSERDEADGGKAVRLAEQQIEQIAQQNDDEDGDPADGEQLPCHVLLAARIVEVPAQQERHHQPVADHDGERHGIDDHHGGGGRQAADKGQ